MYAKRAFDIMVSGCALLVASPILAGIAVAIKMEDGGPVFYRGERIGKDGKPFNIFKFRSMIRDAEKKGASSTSNEDARITRTGKIIRKFKFDELSQLLNVIKGDMSLVGPRPEVKKFVDMYTREEKVILKVRPGITDWASIWNNDEGGVIAKSGIKDADEAYAKLIRPTKILLQLKYIEEMSFSTDLKILMRTAQAVIDKSHDVSDIAQPPGTVEA